MFAIPTFRAALTSRTAAAFSPLSIPGLQLWLDATGALWQDAARTVPAVADGDPVGAWDDASGLGNHVTQGTASSRPTLALNVQNGLPVVRSDGVDDFLAATAFGSLLGAMSLYAVVIPRSLAAHWSVAAASNGSRNSFGVATSSSTSLVGWWQDGGGPVVSYSAVTAGTAYLLGARRSGASGAWSLSLRKNGADDASVITAVNAAGDGDFSVGRFGAFSGFYLNGDVASLLLCDSALSDSLNGQVESYLRTKWGMS